jgi:hypothetical protein
MPSPGRHFPSVPLYPCPDIFFAELQRSKHPEGFFERLMGQPAPKGCVPPSSQQVHAYHAYMSAVETALRMPPAAARQQIAELDEKLGRICEAIRVAIPSARRVNEARSDVITARQDLLQALASR